MVVKNVILNIFSCSDQAPCNKWATEFFADPPLIINVAGSGSAVWRAKVIQWAKTGDLFAAAVKETFPKLTDIEIGKRGLTTFSAGWNFADELFKYDNEINRLDAYLLLDGCHTKELTNWIKFAKRAAEGSAFFVMSHSSIKPPFISSTDSNNFIFSGARQGKQTNKDVPDYLCHAQLPAQGITIGVAAAYKDGKIVLPAISKKWVVDPLIDYNRCGNMTVLGYSGGDRPDHVYIAWYVSKRDWQWLGETWSKIETELAPEPVEPPTPEALPVPKEEPKPAVEATPPPTSKSIFQVIAEFLQSIFRKK